MSDTPPERVWSTGEVIAGKYVVEGVIGDGGMGTVLKALHRELEEFVAIKMLKAAWLAEADVLSRFNREARAIVKLKGEHIARVLDVGRTDDGTPFMVMEYLQGADLGTVMKRGPAAWQDAVDWIIEACDALGEAHSHGIIHRDIKPENLFLVERHGRASVKLLDFGISKLALANEAEPLGMTTRMLGTPLYMSPEQVRASAEVDHRSDIWSLGTVLYELLTGHPPFVADTLPEVCAMILEDSPRALAEFRSDLPPELQRVVARCLAKRADDRFPNVAEFAIELLPLAHPRQHATVEHLTRVLRLAGIAAPQLSSIPPPGTDRRSVTTDPGRLTGTTPGGFERSAAVAPSRKRWLVPALIFAIAGSLIGATLALRSPSSLAAASAREGLPLVTEKARTTPRTEPTPNAPPASSGSAEDAREAPSTPPAPSSSSSPTASPRAPATRPKAAVTKPRPGDSPSAPANSAPPAKPKLEIRMER
ncbi:MAG: serine/threonine-protein kinase [Polyangiaceae bacterium]